MSQDQCVTDLLNFWHLFWFCLFEKIQGVHFGTFHRAGWGDQVTNCPITLKLIEIFPPGYISDLPAQACFLQELLTPENIEPFWVKDPYPTGKAAMFWSEKKIDQVGEIRLD